MRRIAWVLVFAFTALALGGCQLNWSDPFHPRACPRMEQCSPTCCP